MLSTARCRPSQLGAQRRSCTFSSIRRRPTAMAAAPHQTSAQPEARQRRQITVRPMRAEDEQEVESIMQQAFDKQIGVEGAFGGSCYMERRKYAGVALVAEVDGRLAGSNFGLLWGDCGGVGPLSVHPDYWNSGAAQALMQGVMDGFKAAGTRHVELFTFAMSYKHHRLYEKFGLEQGMLSYVMTLPANKPESQQQQSASGHAAGDHSLTAQRLTALSSANAAADALAACKQLCGTLCPGFDIGRELKAVIELGLGEALLLWGSDSQGARQLAAAAAVHSGTVPRSEAKIGSCFIKVAVARDRAALQAIIQAAVAYTAEQGCTELIATVNTANRQAYLTSKALGFGNSMIGVNMQTPGLNAPGAATYNKYDSYLLMDLR